MRPIDADALILALETQDYSCAPDTLADWTPMDMTKAEIADIKNAPTIDQKKLCEMCRLDDCIALTRERGKWEEMRGVLMPFFKCNLCGWYMGAPTAYCANCGARMEKPNE